ncbi:MAG: 6,7-dimethyl-8-ribityllumazine synthase [Candidatus Marinamargulisbacteria bacterium]
MSQFQIPENILDDIDCSGLRVGIVAARFNAPITNALVEGAMVCLDNHCVVKPRVYQVPGAFELPFAAKKLAIDDRYDAIIAFGAVIRGGTPHFDYVCHAATQGILDASLETLVPIIFGILTVDNEQQALERVNPKKGHKGYEAALSAIEMAHFSTRLTGDLD